MNIKSCGICHLFGKHEAMKLVPYMCAGDYTFAGIGSSSTSVHRGEIMRNTTEEQTAEGEVAANIAGIAEAVNSMDLEKYGSLVTEDFVNMNKDLRGDVTSTVGRQGRLDVLKAFFANSPYTTHVTMKPSVIYVDGNRAFARIDGTLKLIPKAETDLHGFTLTVDLFLFFYKEEEHVWLSERSMGIETARTDD